MRPLHGTMAARQSGSALIAVIFLITALAVLGAAMTRMMVLGSTDTINEWRSAQAFYAAESGIEWAIWDLTRAGGNGASSNRLVTQQSWMDTTVTATVVGGRTLYQITGIGKAGGTPTSPLAQRRIIVEFMP